MTTHFLACFSCNKEYIFCSDDSLWNVLAEISAFNVNSCCLLKCLNFSFCYLKSSCMPLLIFSKLSGIFSQFR